MKRFFPAGMALLAIVGVAGCSGEVADGTPYAGAPLPPGPSLGDGGPAIGIRLWAEDHPLLLPFDVVLDGCRDWSHKGVDCVLTDATDATMLIDAVTPEDTMGSPDQTWIDYSNCTPDADGKRVLAISKGGGWMEIYPKCFEMLNEDGTFKAYDVLVAAIVVTHEVGHELGMPHVERMCTPAALVTPDGQRLCGEAVMNPYIDIRTPSTTSVDDLLFDVFVDTVRLPSGANACIYRADAP